MFFAFVVALTMNGVSIQGSPVPYETKEECVVANKKVEDALFKTSKDTGVVAYHFECIKLEPEDFKKPGLDA